MTSSRPLGVGLIGFGLAGSVFHAPLIASAPGLRLAVVVTGNPQRAAQAREQHAGVVVVGAVEQLWRHPLDLVVVATPNRSHATLARDALARGLPVVVDKPLATASGDARDLVADALVRGQMLTVFQNRRWDGDFLTVAELVRTGTLGQVNRFESRFERWRPEVAGGWREEGDPREGGGILLDLGSHLVDQALVLFGPVDRVYAEVDRARAGARADDDVFVALEHRAGTRSHLWMSAVAGDLGPRMRVLGDQGAYVKQGLDPQEAALKAGERPGADAAAWGAEDHGLWGRLGAGGGTRPVPTRAGNYPAFYAGVVRALRDGAPAPVDPADAVASLTVLEAARASAAEHRVVDLEAS